ncbi:MAG: M23 family metallopeptidase [Pseudohongiella sp.]|nr:M23 family metallopeptidase [Pseudohongiella sp.]MDO9522067.1 M23 family metallopeptidase [Pseudohongiella sp.]
MSKNIEAWIDELRDQLPDVGDATVIVTNSEGANYLSMSRNQVDTFRAKQRAKSKCYKVIFCSLSVAFASIIFWAAMEIRSYRADVIAQEQYISKIAGSLGDLSEELPGFPHLQTELLSPDVAGRLDALKRIIVWQDEAFSFYVEATRDLLASNNKDVLDSLQRSGVEYRPDERLDQAVPVGGGGDELGGISDLASYYLNDRITDLLYERTAVNAFLEILPVARPLNSARLTSRFGVRRHPITGRIEAHQGADFVSYTNSDVLATAPGVVVFAGWDGSYGNKVVLDHSNDILTLYAHLESIVLNVGDTVSQGDVLGIMGNTGRSTASHLHYEVHLNGKRIDPLRLIGIKDHVR